MSNSRLSFPIQNFKLIVQACRVDEPLEPTDPRFVDLTILRDGSSCLNELAGSLEQELEADTFHRGILAGHRGSGKSTELLQLRDWADRNNFLCLRVEVDTFLGNSTELEFSDLYLLAAETVERGMIAHNLPLPKNKLESVVRWFDEVTQDDSETRKSELSTEAGAEVGAGMPLLGKLFASFKASVAAGSEHHLNVRRKFKQSPNQLIDFTNELLKEANRLLTNSNDAHVRRTEGILLLFDNLDRYDPTAIAQLLTQGATLMRHLCCHAIYTIPVELRCLAPNVYADGYDSNAILPMPALRSREQLWDQTVQESPFIDSAVAQMGELLARRLDVEALFERPQDAERLVKLSGGCVRDLMHLVNDARKRSSNVSSGTPTSQISVQGVQKGIRDQRDARSEGLLEADYVRLVQVAKREPDAQNLDPLALSLLGKRCILRYGDLQGYWLDVHPLLIETAGFERALKRANPGETSS